MVPFRAACRVHTGNTGRMYDGTGFPPDTSTVQGVLPLERGYPLFALKFYGGMGNLTAHKPEMHVRIFSSILLVVIAFAAASCSEDPIPIYISGNPRVDLERDSVVVAGTAGETAEISNVYLSADGEAYAAGLELKPGGTFVQGNLWKHDGTVWRGALDQAMFDRVLWVHDVDGSPGGTVWAVAELKNLVGGRAFAVLRKDGDTWTDVSPSRLIGVNAIDVVSDDNVWVYGMSPEIYHYQDGEWGALILPEPWGLEAPFDVQVKSISADEQRAFVLLSTDPASLTPPHVFFVYDDGIFTPLYREGEIEGADEFNRELQTLVRSRDGVPIAAGAGIYRWDGSEDGFVHLMNHPEGNLFRDSFLSPEGNMIFAGDNSAMRWSDSEGWYPVHVAAPVGEMSFLSVAMADTMIVATGKISGGESVLLHGTITRIEQ